MIFRVTFLFRSEDKEPALNDLSPSAATGTFTAPVTRQSLLPIKPFPAIGTPHEIFIFSIELSPAPKPVHTRLVHLLRSQGCCYPHLAPSPSYLPMRPTGRGHTREPLPLSSVFPSPQQVKAQV